MTERTANRLCLDTAYALRHEENSEQQTMRSLIKAEIKGGGLSEKRLASGIFRFK